MSFGLGLPVAQTPQSGILDSPTLPSLPTVGESEAAPFPDGGREGGAASDATAREATEARLTL